MGIKLPLTKKKGGDKVADNPPPVFTKHGQGEELLKGHRTVAQRRLSLTNSPHRVRKDRRLSLPNSTIPHSPHNNSDSGISTGASSLNSSKGAAGALPTTNGTSSTAVWIAAANNSANGHRGSFSSESQPAALGPEDEYYYEDDGEYSYIEEIIDELPPRIITIRFDEYDEMQTTIHINDYTKHEISRSWYKRDDYNKMVALARKTAEKVEERTRNLGRKIDKSSKKIEYRGLESWTSMGAAKVRALKENAIEAVWNEQSRQWDAGINDMDKIREVYRLVTKGAQQLAQDRGFSDELISKRILQLEKERKKKKEQRKLLGKSKALMKKSIKTTAGGVVKTAKLGVRTTKLTGKVALKTTKLATKTALATATLDGKMLKEAIIPHKRRECKKQNFRQPSQAALAVNEDPATAGADNHEKEEHGSVDTEKSEKKKKSKLKLLGVVPIPGTHKTYREDRRQERMEKRIEKQKTRPAWEANVSAGKY